MLSYEQILGGKKYDDADIWGKRELFYWVDKGYRELKKAGNGIRTRDIHLGKVTL
jgi:hypothetical protein